MLAKSVGSGFQRSIRNHTRRVAKARVRGENMGKLKKGTDVFWVELVDGMFTLNTGVVVEVDELEVRLRYVNRTPGYCRTVNHEQILRYKTGVLGYFDPYPFYKAPKQPCCCPKVDEHTCPVCGVVE